MPTTLIHFAYFISNKLLSVLLSPLSFAALFSVKRTKQLYGSISPLSFATFLSRERKVGAFSCLLYPLKEVK
jgi:hypothetical protein